MKYTKSCLFSKDCEPIAVQQFEPDISKGKALNETTAEYQLVVTLLVVYGLLKALFLLNIL